jgi:signal transduction histidine kinase
VRGGAAAPLESARVVSAAVLPRRSLSPEGLAAAALAARPPSAPVPVLTLTESTAAADGAQPGSLSWTTSATGVRGEGEVRLEDGLYHAHVELNQDPPVVRVARGVLLLAIDLLVLTLVWAIAHALAGGGLPPPAPWLPSPGSFRMRVSLALFLFFLAPALAFGAVAYRALAGTAEREAEAVATRTSRQAAEILSVAGGNLQTVAELVGLDVLFYQNGELLTSSRPELVELGVHNAWLPPDAFLALHDREALAVDRRRSLLGRRALAAFRRLPSGIVGVLALPGAAAATRRAELTDMLLFAVLLGGALSLALSLAAGRLLARPIGQLSRAASAVGAGHLRVRLPADRRDEFGELFRSFNRMTRRLRRARTRELRSARVLAWGEMARQVAHEIKNPLTPIRLSVQHVRRAYSDERDDFGDILETNVDQILHEIDRLSDIARAFARYGTPADRRPALEPVDVGAVARDVEALYGSGLDGFALTVTTVDAPPAAARDGELREVLINLLENARAAIGEAGSVAISVRPEGEAVVLEVTDDGEGIAADALPSVFEPRFSTRSSGTGLGLAIVKRLVEDWGGSVDVESRPGRGSTFRVRMRRFADAA